MATRIKSKFKTVKLMTPKGVSEPYVGSYISGKLGGVKVVNESLKKYYGKKVDPNWTSKTQYINSDVDSKGVFKPWLSPLRQEGLTTWKPTSI